MGKVICSDSDSLLSRGELFLSGSLRPQFGLSQGVPDLDARCPTKGGRRDGTAGESGVADVFT